LRLIAWRTVGIAFHPCAKADPTGEATFALLLAVDHRHVAADPALYRIRRFRQRLHLLEQLARARISPQAEVQRGQFQLQPRRTRPLDQHALIGGDGGFVIAQARGQHRIGKPGLQVGRVVQHLLEQLPAFGFPLRHLGRGHAGRYVVSTMLCQHVRCHPRAQQGRQQHEARASPARLHPPLRLATPLSLARCPDHVALLPLRRPPWLQPAATLRRPRKTPGTTIARIPSPPSRPSP
jgi:hypothetical protein